VRRLVYSLEWPDKEWDPDWTYAGAQEYTDLTNKYAHFIAVLLALRAKAFYELFFGDIVGVDMFGREAAPAGEDKFKASYNWRRVEYTADRGVQHYHTVTKVPNVLDCSVLCRMVHNGRVIREELKCGNIKPDKVDEAWSAYRMGLLADRYLCMYAESWSSTAFYTEQQELLGHQDPDKVIDLDR